VQNPEAVQRLLRPYPAEAMACHSVSRYVNNTRNDGPECIALVEITDTWVSPRSHRST
jgi:putative SOS response-associated peptidase YedK